jgi:hypothetical protein
MKDLEDRVVVILAGIDQVDEFSAFCREYYKAAFDAVVY